MAIITLTTDYGPGGYYLPRLKGALLSACPGAQLTDLAHHINNYDIVQAAFLFRNAWHRFPKGTIHLIGVNDIASAAPRFLAVAHRGHYFIAPDNGLFNLIFADDQPVQYREVLYEHSELMGIEQIYARAAGHLHAGRPVIEIGPAAEGIVQRITLQPVISPALIRGSIIYIDHYENAITNIHQLLFEQVGAGLPFELYFKRHDPIRRLSHHYHEVEVGEPLCLFNSAGLLEIAVNMGKAGSLLGLKAEDTVQVEFKT